MTKQQINSNIYGALPQILDLISEEVIIYDSSLRIVVINKTGCEMLHIERKDALGKTPDWFVENGYIDQSILKKSLTAKKTTKGIIRTPDGEEYLYKGHPFFNPDGTLQFAVGTSTSLKYLNSLKVKLEEERAKTENFRQENEQLRRYVMRANEHFFTSQSMQSMTEFVKKVTPMDCTVLIMGESGVGKEVLAKMIHANSPRSHMPFIPVSIPAIPENLLEAELFGYEEGAFTGSKRGGKKGLFEMAQGGTIFLDEVGDIPLNVQIKMLRAIENQEITRLGGTQSIKLNTRIISATNKDMYLEVEKGKFREDLFYRLNVVPFIIKPLRERREIIIPLSLNFLKENNMRYHLEKTFSDDAFEELRNYNWPGNIRQLKNVIERLSILSDHQIITGLNVQEVLSSDKVSPRSYLASKRNIGRQEKHENNISILSEYESYERLRILDALKKAGGNKKRAAKMLGMSRNKLYRELQG